MKKWFGKEEIPVDDIGYKVRKIKRVKRILITLVIIAIIAFVIVNDSLGIKTFIIETINSIDFLSQKNDLILVKGDTGVYPCSFINASGRIGRCEYKCGLENKEYNSNRCFNETLNCYCNK